MYLASCRARAVTIGRTLNCSRNICARHVAHGETLLQALQKYEDKSKRRILLEWLNKAGPFWSDDRVKAEDDCFHYEAMDITDEALAEAARRNICGSETSTFSFEKGGFDSSPLIITHGLLEDPIGIVPLHNFTEKVGLERSIQAATPLPQSWEEMLQLAKDNFPLIYFAPECIAMLRNQPFSTYASERFMELCRVLNELVGSRTDTGAWTIQGQKLIDDHFSGGKAWFSDESEQNKADFKKQLTFADPKRPGESVFCPFHGKVKTPQYRLHIEWPITKSMPQARVFYFGPKITRT